MKSGPDREAKRLKHIPGSPRLDLMMETVYQSILLGDSAAAVAGVGQALDGGADPKRVLNEQMIAAMVEVGRLYEEQEYFIPEMMIAARAMKDALAVLRPNLVERGVESVGKVVIGTVKGDLHDIGKNLVAIMLEGVGFEVIDLGTDVSPAKLVSAVKEHTPQIVGLSALLTTTMPHLETTIRSLEEAGLREGIGVMVGGAPVSQEYATKVGADLYAPDAASAAKRAIAYLRDP
jgi:5-methyltetrahydrofolate--homocysteine methyltransferase